MHLSFVFRIFEENMMKHFHSLQQFGFIFSIFVHQIFAVVFDAVVCPFSIHTTRWAAHWALARWTREMAAGALWIQTVTVIAAVASIASLFVVDVLGSGGWHLSVTFARQFTTLTS